MTPEGAIGAVRPAMGSESGRIAVLIVSYNVRELLARCLTSVRDADEVIVVDNASADGTLNAIRRDAPWVRLVANETNVGFATAVNQAARLATADVLLLLNPDAELPDGTLDAMRDAMDRRPDAAVIGFRQTDAQGVFQLAVGPRPSFVAELVRMVVQRRLDAGDVRLAQWLDRRLERTRQVPWVSGAALLVRAPSFHAIGGFDESFFLYFEDADFCMRARAQGKVYYVPSVRVIHHRGRSRRSNASVAERAYRESQLVYWRRYRGSWSAALIAGYQRLRMAFVSRA
jgi:GT2 family glycosyltransferase